MYAKVFERGVCVCVCVCAVRSRRGGGGGGVGVGGGGGGGCAVRLRRGGGLILCDFYQESFTSKLGKGKHGKHEKGRPICD